MIENQLRTTQIVAAYVRKNLIRTDQIAGLINSVHSTLSGLSNQFVEEPPRVPAVSIRRSVHADYIICIECGFKGKILKGHLQSRHGLSVTQYRSRWKLSAAHPMTAANYSERRSQLAKSLGLGRGPATPAAILEAAPEVAPEKPTRRRAARKAAKTRTIAKKASAKTTTKKASAKTTTKKASSKTSAKKASGQKASSSARAKKVSGQTANSGTRAKRASSKTSAKTASNRSRSRKPAARATSKAASVPEVATA
jgi:predicted transcriptional regulator